MVPAHEIAGEWRSWQRTCFGSLEALSGVGSTRAGMGSASDGPSIILRFRLDDRLNVSGRLASPAGTRRPGEHRSLCQINSGSKLYQRRQRERLTSSETSHHSDGCGDAEIDLEAGCRIRDHIATCRRGCHGQSGPPGFRHIPAGTPTG